MKDIKGNEIKVGDEIAYTSSPYAGPRLTTGKVAVTENSATINREYCSCAYNFNKKFVYDSAKKTGEFVYKKSRNTTVGFESRIVILSR